MLGGVWRTVRDSGPYLFLTFATQASAPATRSADVQTICELLRPFAVGEMRGENGCE